MLMMMLLYFKLEENPIDTKEIVNQNKILSFDIEVYNAEGMPSAKKDAIIMMSLCGNNGFKKVFYLQKKSKDFVETLPTEEDMLKKIC